MANHPSDKDDEGYSDRADSIDCRTAFQCRKNGIEIVNKLSAIGYWKLVLFGKPESDRAIYKAAAKAMPLSIVEFGLENAVRAENIIRVVQRRCEDSAPIKYTGIDLFEGRPSGEKSLPLIEAHRKLSRTGAKIRLLPGDFVSSIQRLANQLQNVDLMIVTARQPMNEISASWFFVPRMLSESGFLMLKCTGEGDETFLRMSRKEIETLAQRTGPNNASRRIA